MCGAWAGPGGVQDALDQLWPEPLRLQLRAAVHTFCDFALEYVKLQNELDQYKMLLEKAISAKTTCNDCPRHLQSIATKDNILEALGSLVMRMYETRNFDQLMPEVFEMISRDSPFSTPPPDCDETNMEIGKNNKQQINDNHKQLSSSKKNPSPLKLSYVIQNTAKVHNKCSDEKNKSTISDESSELSITEESVSEINGTPSCPKSPIIGIKKTRNRSGFESLDVQKSFGKMILSPQGKITKSPKTSRSRRSQPKLVQSRLALQKKPSRTVDVTSSEDFGGGVRSLIETRTNPALEHVRTSTEDEDVIMPSPTSGKTDFTFLNRISETTASRTSLFKRPSPVCSGDRTSLILQGVDFDEPMETEIIIEDGALPDNEQRAIKPEPLSPNKTALTENHNVDNLRDTNVSLSVLRQPMGGVRTAVTTERENVAPSVGGKRSTKLSLKSPKKAPEPEPYNAANLPTQCDVDNSISILRNYDLPTEKVASNGEGRKDACPRVELEKPEYIYKEEVVRKRAEKRVLPGWSCDECKNYYTEMYKNDFDKLYEAQQRCSKHRGRFNPARADTPPGFWNNHFTVPEDTEEFNRQNNALTH